MINLNQAITELKAQKVNVKRSPIKLSFGNKGECRKLFEEAFRSVDESIKEYKRLPEYDQVIDWMTDNEGKGLFLTGDCGRGKSNIITGVIPTIFFMKFGKIIRPISAYDIPETISSLVKKRIVNIDEIGVEPVISDYGKMYEGFNRVIDAIEAKIGLLFVSTNLTGVQMLSRYGERTMDRINRLCRIVKFEGESLR